MSDAFDADYFQRFYGAHGRSAQGAADAARLCRFVTAAADAQIVSLDAVVEVGAGAGLWRDWFARHRASTRYVSTDVSAFACERYHHRRLDIAREKLSERFDLVVCQGVLPYLADADALRAMDHLAAMTGSLLYLECQTARDIAEVCDPKRTDPALIARPARFYVERLERSLIHLGLNLWAPTRAAQSFWELESGTLARR
ncbi:MAG: class I SAM-dependent methyltransferase [Polyangiales bacterium]